MPWFQCSLDGVTHQVDQHLFKLIRINHQLNWRAGKHLHRQTGLQRGYALNNRSEQSPAHDGRRYLRELTVRLQETIEGVGSGLDDREPTLKVLPWTGFRWRVGNLRPQSSCN